MGRTTSLPSQFWQDRLTGVVIACSAGFTPDSPEWRLAYRRVRLLRHRLTGFVTIEDATIANSLLSDPNVREMSFAEYTEWKTIQDNTDI